MNILSLKEGQIGEAFANGKITVAVIGLGYVGQPLAVHLAKKGLNVIGVDRRKEVIQSLIQAKPTIYEPGLSEGLKETVNKKFTATENLEKAVRQSDIIFVTVGTPIDKKKNPILKDVIEVTENIAENLTKGKLIILRSTLPPRTTEDKLKPLLEKKSKLKAGKDFGLAFAPERIVEGQALKELQTNPEIIGGIDDKSTAIALTFFKATGHEVVEASCPRVAEMAKVFDNVYRDVNIALANELALICEKLGVDIIDTLKVCNTGPRTRVLIPGAGVGGSCLNKDPYILDYLAGKKKFKAEIIKTARKRNEGMPKHIVELVKSAFREMKKEIQYSKIAVLGLSFKADTDDLRNTVAKPIIKVLKAMNVKLKVYDPYVSLDKIKSELGEIETAEEIEGAIKGADCVLILADHPQFKNFNLNRLKKLIKTPGALVDGRHVFNPKTVIEEGIIFRGVGRPNSFYKEVYGLG